jgi:hypothetical protein
MSITLTLKLTKTIFDKIVCYEPINSEVLSKLIKSNLLMSSHDFYDNELQQLEKYKLLLDKKGLIRVEYLRSKGKKYGRVNPKQGLGLHCLRRQIRHSLVKHSMVDIDIVNCHPVLLLQICQKLGFNCNYLFDYVSNRDDILKQVIEQYDLEDILEEQYINTKKDRAKTLFIILLYGGSFNKWLKDNNINGNDKPITQFINNLSKQLETIGDLILNANPDLVKNIEKCKEEQMKTNYNIKSSVLSHYLQEYENNILEHIYVFLKDKKVIINNVCALCNDGIMIEKDKYYNGLLDQIIEYLNERTEFKLSLKVKELNEDVLDILDQNLTTEEDVESYEYKKREFEKIHFKVLNPVQYIEIKDNGSFIARSEKKFMAAYRHYSYIEVETNKEQKFINKWMDDKKMRNYKEIDFKPMHILPDNIFNAFHGFNAYNKEENELYDNVDIKETLIYKHLENLCGNDKNVIEYVELWLSRKLKNPSNLTNTALIFKSIEGVGKDLFFNWFGNSIMNEDYYFNDDDIEGIIGKHNTSIINKILIIINETNARATFDISENIKNGITKQTNKIEPKGIDKYSNTNNIGYVFLTNNDNPLKIPPNDRRFVAIECNNKYAKNDEYFRPLIKQFNDGFYNKAFYNYLISLKSDDYDFTGLRPETKLYKNIQSLNISPIVYFFEKLIFTLKGKYKKIEYSSSVLFQDYNDFMTESKYDNKMTATRFGSLLSTYEECIEKKRKNDGNYYIIDYKKLYKYLVDKNLIEPIDKDFIKE